MKGKKHTPDLVIGKLLEGGRMLKREKRRDTKANRIQLTKGVSQNPKLVQMNAISRISMHSNWAYLDYTIPLCILMQP